MERGLPDERLVFVDLETAGGEPTRPIIQIAAIAVSSGLGEIERFEAKLRFRQRDADPRSLFGSKYSREVWQEDAISECCAIELFSAFLWKHATVDQVTSAGKVFQVAQVVAHNARYDAAFLAAWFGRHERFLPASPRYLCTMQRAIWLFHEDKHLTPPSDFRLATLANYFGVPFKHATRHDALVDVEATVGVYRAMQRWVPGAKQRGVFAPPNFQFSSEAEDGRSHELSGQSNAQVLR